MTTLLYSPANFHTYNVTADDEPVKVQDESKVEFQQNAEAFLSGDRQTLEMLKLSEVKLYTPNATMFYNQSVSNKYKEVSEFVSCPQDLKPQRKKKTMKDLMRQSVFHGANWIGNNFIA